MSRRPAFCRHGSSWIRRFQKVKLSPMSDGTQRKAKKTIVCNLTCGVRKSCTFEMLDPRIAKILPLAVDLTR
jgi:hypothetical protein